MCVCLFLSHLLTLISVYFALRCLAIVDISTVDIRLSFISSHCMLIVDWFKLSFRVVSSSSSYFNQNICRIMKELELELEQRALRTDKSNADLISISKSTQLISRDSRNCNRLIVWRVRGVFERVFFRATNFNTFCTSHSILWSEIVQIQTWHFILSSIT